MENLRRLKSPPLPMRRLEATAMSEKAQIAAVDERHPGFDEGDHGISQRRGLPRLGIDARRAIDRYGDVAIGGAVHAAVGGAEPQTKATALIGGHAGIAQRRTSEPGSREPGDRIDAVENVVIDRNDRRELIAPRRAGQQENLEVVFRETGI